MTDQVLTRAQLDAIFQPLTASLTGMDPNGGARLKWQTNGAPGWRHTDDVVALGIFPSDEPIIQPRDTNYAGASGDGVNLNVQASYSRVHLVQWTFYGPNGYDNAEVLRNGLYGQAARDTLAASNLFMVLQVAAVVRLPELRNGGWWERADLSARFNESVVRYGIVPYLASADITVIDDSGDTEVI